MKTGASLKDLRIVQETINELIVYKPAGMACEKRVDNKRDSLLSRLSDTFNSPLYLPHRLDGVTCGIVLTARSKEAVAYYNKEIAERRWKKYYIARVKWDGRLTADGLLGTHKAYLKRKGQKAAAVRSGGAPSFLEILAIGEIPGHADERHVLIKLLTGRYHQIRVMFQNLGLPLCGDPLYGIPGDTSPFYLEHAALGYVEMGSGKWTCILTPPKDLDEKVDSTLYERLKQEVLQILPQESSE